jgi:hypothetical protein
MDWNRLEKASPGDISEEKKTILQLKIQCYNRYPTNLKQVGGRLGPGASGLVADMREAGKLLVVVF